MYSPVVATARLTRAMDAIRLRFPSASAETVPSADHLAALDALWTPHPTDWKKGERVRDLTEAEAMLIEVEIAKAKCDFRYWLAHYARIKDKDARSRLVTPLLDSQEMMIRLMGTLEEAALRGQRNDGILIAALKARQVGLSTLTELALLHRTALYGNLYALIAADVEEQSANLFDMTERALRALPWWMRPRITNHVKDSELNFGDIDSLLRVTFANTTRGGTQIGFEKGQLGRGSTPHLFHGSEMSTWSNAGQVDDALLPAIPKGPNTLAVLESTARGRNWWYRTWLSAKAGDSRWVPLFIPWYAESRYRDRPPTDWLPLDETLKHAIHAEAVSHRWMGHTVTLDREQLYFWEKNFLHAKKERKLFKFLAEYAADDEDCFRVSDDGFFDGETLLRLRQSAHPPLAVLELV